MCNYIVNIQKNTIGEKYEITTLLINSYSYIKKITSEEEEDHCLFVNFDVIQ